MSVLTKVIITYVDRITEDGQLNVKRATRVFEDGVPIMDDKIARVVLTPGMDVSGYPVRVQRIATAEWTPAVIAAWQAAHPNGPNG